MRSLNYFLGILILTKFVSCNITLIESHGYRAEEHTVETEDKFILTMFRIPNPGKPAVLLQHGIFCLSTDWLLFGPKKSLAYELANDGYDVWLGNFRGNFYSRKHKKLSEKHKQFFDFSFHEMGIYDLPAMIEHILSETKRPNLHFIGHSAGTSAFFVMTTRRKEMNDKIKSAHVLGPAVFFKHMETAVYKNMLTYSETLYSLIDTLKTYEHKLTDQDYRNLMFEEKKDPQILELTILPRSAAYRDLYHFSQLMKSDNKFHEFNYTEDVNLLIYGQKTPLEYNLSEITVPIYIYHSSIDKTAAHKDVITLANNLKSVGRRFLMKGVTHVEMIWNSLGGNWFYKNIVDIINKSESHLSERSEL